MLLGAKWLGRLTMDSHWATTFAWAIITVSAVLLLLGFLWKRYLIIYRHLPGPQQSLLGGNFQEIHKLRKQNLPFQLILKNWHDQHGDLFKFRIFHMTIVVVADPKEIRRLLADGEKFPKSRRYEEFDQLYGTRLIPQGILVEQNQQIWNIKRRILNTFFKRSAIDEYLECFNDAANRLLLRIRTTMAQNDGEPFSLYPLLTETALDSVLRALFNLKIDKFEGLAEKVGKIFPALQAQLRSPLKKIFPGEKEKNVAAVLAEIREACKDIITENLNKNVGGLFKNNFCEISICESSHVDEVVDDVLVMVLAGTDSTANTLGFLLREMCHHRPYQDRMSQEIRATMNLDEHFPTRNSLSKLTFTQQMINETLRKYPTICGTTRTCREDTIINGLLVPADTVIMISTYLVHHNAKYWKDPSNFDPERFATETKAPGEDSAKDDESTRNTDQAEASHQNQNTTTQKDPVKNGCFLPFSRGQRVCIGANFAKMEMQIVLARLLSEFDIECMSSYKSTNYQEVLALRPDDAVPVRLTKLVKH